MPKLEIYLSFKTLHCTPLHPPLDGVQGVGLPLGMAVGAGQPCPRPHAGKPGHFDARHADSACDISSGRISIIKTKQWGDFWHKNKVDYQQ